MNDPRYIALRRGLEQLTTEEINRILSYNKEMVYDDFNFDPISKRF